MPTEDCEKLVAKALTFVQWGIITARAYKRAAECLSASGSFEEAIRYFKEAANTVMKVDYPSARHYVFAIQCLVEASELSLQIDRYKEVDQCREKINRLLKSEKLHLDRSLISRISAIKHPPPHIVVSKNLPEVIKENESLVVNVEFISRYKDAYDVKLLEQVSEDFEIVDGMTQWTGDLPVEKKISLNYRLRPKSFGKFVLKPTQITFKDKTGIKTFTSKGESFEIRVVPTSIKIVKQLSIEETNVGKEVEIKIVAVNKSEKDIYNVVFSDEVPEKQDFDYVGSSSTVRKKLRKDETRTFKSKLIPKTIGEFKLGSATLKFLDRDGVEFELKSNDLKLKVTEKPIESNKIEHLQKVALEDKLLKIFKSIEKLETRISALEEKIRLCPKCGALVIDPKSKFCGICGQKID